MHRNGRSASDILVPDLVGTVPGTPLTMQKRRRIASDPRKRAEACRIFAENPVRYRSLKLFIEAQQQAATPNEWMPNTGQMSRDMRTLFGPTWPALRGSGGRGVAGGASKKSDAPGLIMPPDAHHLLNPNHHPTSLSSATELCYCAQQCAQAIQVG